MASLFVWVLFCLCLFLVGVRTCSLRTHFPICVTDLVSTNRCVSFRYKCACCFLPFCVNGQCWNNFPPVFLPVNAAKPSSLRINLWTWLSVLLTSNNRKIFIICSSSIRALSEKWAPYCFFFPLVCICWIIEVNGVFLFLWIICVYLSAAQTASCESCISAGFMWS